jgi:OOP family OmpA-OmpF porin
MNNQRLLLAGAAVFTVALSVAGATAQQYQAVPSQQEIETKLRGLPTLGTAPAPAPNPVMKPANVAPSEAYRPESYRTEPPHHRAISRPPTRPSTAVSAPTRSVPAQNAKPSLGLRTITFKFDSAELTPESEQTLQNLGNALNQGLKEVTKFIIQGHTDRTGKAAYNEDLSKRRAEAVKDYLVNKMGVEPDRLESVGLGSSEPANPRNPYAAENRRVVVVNAGNS